MTTTRALTVRAARVTATLAALATLVAAIPWVLTAVVGNPLTGLPHLTDTDISGAQIQHVLALIVWALWALFLIALATEAHCAIRGIHAPRIRPLTPMQALAALLIAGFLASAAAGAAPAARPAAVVTTIGTAPAGWTALHGADAAPAGATAATSTAETAVRHADGSRQVVFQIGEHHYLYRVHRGDTLWAISGQWLGDHDRWPDIVPLNQSHYPQLRTHHGNLIEPGWILRLPADATPPPGAIPTTPPGHHTAHPPATVTPPTPMPPSPAASAVPTPDPGPAHTHAAPTQTAAPAPRTPPVAGVALPGHDWLDLGLASTLLAAAALVWAHRRRRYTPRPPSASPRRDDPDLTPMPHDIATVRHALRTPPDTETSGIETSGPDDSGFADIAPLDDPDPYPEDGDPTDEAAAPTDTPATVELPALTIPASTYPAAAAWPPAGLGLTGPGADAAACGFLVSALADRHGGQKEERPQVVIPSGSLATLLGTDAVLLGTTPRLTVTACLDDALDVLDRAILTRTRLVRDTEAGSGDITTARDSGFLDEPVPPLLLIADTIEHRDRARIAAILTQGEHLDIHGVLLGPWPHGSTVTVARDGVTNHGEPHPEPGDRPSGPSRLTVLEPARAADLIRVAIEADTGEPQPRAVTVRDAAPPPSPAPSSDAPMASPADVRTAGPDTGDTTPIHDGQPDRPAPAPDSAAAAIHGHGTAHGDDPDSAQTTTGPHADDTRDDEPGDTGAGSRRTSRIVPPVRGPARVRLFSRDVIIEDLPADSTKKPPFRLPARDILTYLVLHPGQVPDDRIADHILPDVRVSVVRPRMNTHVWALRANLEAAAGAQRYLQRPKRGGWTELLPAAFDVDVWRLREHLTAAEHAPDPRTRIAALRAAIGEYTGPLMARIEQDWIEPFRQGYLRQIIDARSALATLLAPTDTDEALTVLTDALRLDPYSEALYLQAMSLHAVRGDVEGIRALRRDATHHLSDIDAEPSDELITAADRFIGEIKQRRPGRHR